MQRFWIGLCGLVAATLVLAGCGDTGDGAAATEAATAAPTSAATLAPEGTRAEQPTTTVSPAVTTAVPPATTTSVAPMPSTTTTTLPAAVELGSVVGSTRSGEGWLVEPGHYSHAEAGVPFRLHLTEPVVYVPFDTGLVFLADGFAGDDEFDGVFIEPGLGVLPPDEIGVHPPHEPPIPINTQPFPENLGDWFDAAAQLDVTEATTVDVGGQDSHVWTVAVDAGAGETFRCTQFGNCVATLVTPSGVYTMGDRKQFQIWHVPTDDGVPLVLWAQSLPENWSDTKALAEMIVRGLTIIGLED